MNLYSRRRRAKELAKGGVEKSGGTDDEDGDLDDLDLDYSGIATDTYGEPEEDRERFRELAKSLGSDEDDEVMKAVTNQAAFTGTKSDLSNLSLDYSDIMKSDEEREREALARELADELERRGVTPDEDGGTVEKFASDAAAKAVEETEELADLVREYVEEQRGAA